MIIALNEDFISFPILFLFGKQSIPRKKRFVPVERHIERETGPKVHHIKLMFFLRNVNKSQQIKKRNEIKCQSQEMPKLFLIQNLFTDRQYLAFV